MRLVFGVQFGNNGLIDLGLMILVRLCAKVEFGMHDHAPTGCSYDVAIMVRLRVKAAFFIQVTATRSSRYPALARSLAFGLLPRGPCPYPD